MLLFWPALAPLAQSVGGNAAAGSPNLHIVTIGHGPELPVIVIHGGPGVTHDYLRPEWDALGGDRRVVYYDQRGCGKSGGGPSGGWRADLFDLGRVVDSVGGPRGRVILAGTSWGTRLAMLFASQHPDRVAALVLSGTPLWPRNSVWALAQLPKPIKSRLDSLSAGVPVARVPRPDSEALARRNPYLPPEVVGRIARAGVCDDVMLMTNASWVDLTPLEELKFAGPILAIRGSAPKSDEAANVPGDGASEVQRYFPQTVVVDIANGGHDPWYSKSKEFFDAVQRFVNQIASMGR